MPDIPFRYRVAGLLVLMVVVATVDRVRNGAQATRYKEYGFILFCGILGAIIGAGNDLITSSISPEYFVLGKDLPPENLRTEAGFFGLNTGFSAGIIGGAISVFALGKRRPPFSRLLCLLCIPVLGALAFAGTLPWLLSGYDPAGYTAQLTGLLSPEQLGRFRVVWWIHTGLYSGLVMGLVVLVIVGRRSGGFGVFHIRQRREGREGESLRS